MDCKDCQFQHLNNADACAGCFEEKLEARQNYRAPANADKGRADKTFTYFNYKRVVQGMVAAYQATGSMDLWDSVDMGSMRDSYPTLNWKYDGGGRAIESKATAVITAAAKSLIKSRRATINNLAAIMPVPVDVAEVGLSAAPRRAGIIQRVRQTVLSIFKEKTLDDYAIEIKRHAPELECIISGTWLWIAGNPSDFDKHKSYLRGKGLKFVSRKNMYCIASREEMKRQKSGLVDQNRIYAKYGRKVVN